MAPLLAAILLAAAATVDAGCFRGRPHAPVPDARAFFNHTPAPLLPESRLPKSFSWADVDGHHLLVPSWNQHEPIYCGSCWAHASLSMVSDRIKIRKKGVGPDTMLSRQTLLNCAAYKGMGAGCDGGDVADVFHYMAKYGLPDESCLTYTATDHTKFSAGLGHCPAGGFCVNCMPIKGKDTCWAVKTPILYHVTAFGRVGDKPAPSAGDAAPGAVTLAGARANVRAMQSEILARGPIVCSISTPDDFVYKYRGGVYADRNNTTPDDIDHDVELVGWGTDADAGDYWVVRNSWGTFWGELGFFRLQRGVNALFVENGDCWYAEPEFEMETRVRDGELAGSMYGIVDARGHRAAVGGLVRA